MTPGKLPQLPFLEIVPAPDSIIIIVIMPKCLQEDCHNFLLLATRMVLASFLSEIKISTTHVNCLQKTIALEFCLQLLKGSPM